MENYNKNLFDRFLAGIAAVNVKTHDEYDQFMRILEKETNLKWRLGQKPTQLDMFTSHREKTCIDRVVGRYMIRYSDISYYDLKGYEIIEFSDLMKKENKSMKFKVGDKVRVRSWESMEKEFGFIDKWNTISNGFTTGMRNYCGNIYEIREVDDYWYFLKTCSNYYFTYEMLEPVKAETNGEHFRNELRELKGHLVAIKNGKPATCGETYCPDCLFSHNNHCNHQKDEFKKWCAEPYKAPKEENKPILDKVEHDYLASVIAPKRIYKYVDYIVKRQVNEFYVIDVHIKHTTYSAKMMLSYFKKSESMYDGMKVERQYTLKELGLEKE